MNSLDLLPKALINGKPILMTPIEVMELQVEIMVHHPLLVKELEEKLAANNYEFDMYLGIIAAYCEIVLDGTYDTMTLVNKLYHSLLKKRDVIIVATKEINDVVPMPRPMFDSIEQEK